MEGLAAAQKFVPVHPSSLVSVCVCGGGGLLWHQAKLPYTWSSEKRNVLAAKVIRPSILPLTQQLDPKLT